VRVLVTDADYKLTLGAIRSLGKRGATVVAVAASPRALGFRSRYAAKTLLGPPPTESEAFVDFVADAARDADAILPIGQDSTRALSLYRERLPAPAPLAPPEALAIADSKRRTIEVARKLGINTPADATSFPAVAKNPTGSGQVRYVASADEVPEGWIAQAYIRGEGRGLFALFDRGEERAVFMHRRLREFPVTGGASTAAESIDDPELRDLGLRLLRELAWHGVAMVEFKRRPDGEYVLMEINPKFWGSLDLAIAAGVDFPWLAVQLALGVPIEAVHAYRVGVRYQWLYSDLVHVAARPTAAGAFLADLVRAEHDVTASDLRPAAWEALLTAATLARRLRTRTLRRPHGRPPAS
jgi:predicted ATP-grasp superfamily ATP-dependent carboligase